MANILQRIAQIARSINPFRIESAYAPIDTDAGRPIYENNKLKQSVINSAIRDYGFTTGGQQSLKDSNIYFTPNVQGVGGFYNNQKNNIVLNRSKYNRRGEANSMYGKTILPHEFTHQLDYQGLINNELLSRIMGNEPQLDSLLKRRLQDWGTDYDTSREIAPVALTEGTTSKRINNKLLNIIGRFYYPNAPYIDRKVAYDQNAYDSGYIPNTMMGYSQVNKLKKKLTK